MNKIQKIPSVEDVQACVRPRERLITNSNPRNIEYAKYEPMDTHSQEGVAACNR